MFALREHACHFFFFFFCLIFILSLLHVRAVLLEREGGGGHVQVSRSFVWRTKQGHAVNGCDIMQRGRLEGIQH